MKAGSSVPNDRPTVAAQPSFPVPPLITAYRTRIVRRPCRPRVIGGRSLTSTPIVGDSLRTRIQAEGGPPG